MYVQMRVPMGVLTGVPKSVHMGVLMGDLTNPLRVAKWVPTSGPRSVQAMY
jgi:hypothetical protein